MAVAGKLAGVCFSRQPWAPLHQADAARTTYAIRQPRPDRPTGSDRDLPDGLCARPRTRGAWRTLGQSDAANLCRRCRPHDRQSIPSRAAPRFLAMAAVDMGPVDAGAGIPAVDGDLVQAGRANRAGAAGSALRCQPRDRMDRFRRDSRVERSRCWRGLPSVGSI